MREIRTSGATSGDWKRSLTATAPVLDSTKWRNRHNACLRADRGALTQTDWPSFKSAQQRAARRQALPNQFTYKGIGGAQKARPSHRAARQGNQPSLRLAAQLAGLLIAMTIAPLVQRLP
jgi:hypothetical protein